MGRETSPFVWGDYWLDKRRDGRSPNVWQIASYRPSDRQVVYRSTRTSCLEAAKGEIRAYEEEQRAKGKQRPEDARVVPLLFNYWAEHGRRAKSASQIASSIRQFIGFLMQDEATEDVTVAQLDKQLFERFRAWRMAPHGYEVPWGVGTISHTSKGVSGEAVQRNLDDIRAALNHQTGNNRLPYVPKVPSVEKRYRSPARDKRLAVKELGAIIGYSAYHIEALRWVLLMVGTAVRPDAGLAMDPRRQYDAEHGLVDLHPPAWERTKKHNPVVPVIPQLAPWLAAWAENPHKPVLSRKTHWRMMRKALGLPANVVPKTIRHTIATMLRSRGVPGEQISALLGHSIFKGSTGAYAKYDPQYLQEARAALSTIWDECCAAAHEWLAVHSLSTPQRGIKLTVLKNGCISRDKVVGADGLEPPTLSV